MTTAGDDTDVEDDFVELFESISKEAHTKAAIAAVRSLKRGVVGNDLGGKGTVNGEEQKKGTTDTSKHLFCLSSQTRTPEAVTKAG